jgi:hypothetical protein
MTYKMRVVILLLVFGTLSGMFPVNTAAQCGGGLIGLGGVKGLSGNPFRAEVKQTFQEHNAGVVRTIHPGMQQVARDTQGRVRIDINAGKFKVQSGPGEGTEEEQHHITICDPVKGESILLDTLNKTATVLKTRMGLAATQSPAGDALPSFCSRQFRMPPNFPDTEVEDLGHRSIEGMDAQGMRQRRTVQLQNGVNSGASAPPLVPINVTETWCSEELGAVILRVTGTEEERNTTTIAMVNIQRGEPDEALFQIPPDYRVAERVNDPAPRTGVGVVSGYVMVSPASKTPPPDKP